MGIWEILLIGIGLSMDAVAVSLCNAMAYPNQTKVQKLEGPVSFGLFQGLMPLLGYFAGSLLSDFISRYAGIITLVILGFIGVKMIKDSRDGCPVPEAGGKMSRKTLLMQSVATSIDAFAVGVTFCAGGANIFLAAPLIALCTFLCCVAAMAAGRRFGAMLGCRAQVFGGILLILIGIKALF